MFSLYEFLVGYQNHVLQDSTSDCEMNPRSNYMTFSITPAYALEQHPYSYRYQRWVENNCPVYLADNYLRRGSDIRGIFNNLTQAEMYTYLRMNVSHFRPTDEAFELMMKPYNWTALSQYILKNNTTMNSFIAVNESTTDVYASNYRGARFELLELQKHMHDAYQTRTHQTTRSDDTHGPQFILSTIYLISLSVVFFPIAFYCINKCTNGRAKIVANQFVELMARPFEKIGMLRRIPDANNPEDDPELETTTMIHHQ